MGLPWDGALKIMAVLNESWQLKGKNSIYHHSLTPTCHTFHTVVLRLKCGEK